MQLTVAICDDNEEQIAELRRLLGQWAADKPLALVIDEYVSAESFLFSYPDRPCSLLLLDIEMGRLNGMELAKKLRRQKDMLPIVFVTGYSEYMGDGYEVEALHFLLKPVDQSRLFSVLDRYLARHVPEREFLLKSDEGITHISPDAILYCEAMGKKTEVYLSDGQVLVGNMGISGLKASLTEEFVFCHRSYLVNLRYVHNIKKDEVRLDNGVCVPVSRRLYGELNERFIRYYTEKAGSGGRV